MRLTEQLLGADVARHRLPRDDADAEAAADHRLDDLDVLRLHHDLGLDPLAREEFVDQPARDRAGLEQDERLPVEIGGRDAPLHRQRMVRVGRDEQLLVEHRHRDEIGGVDRQRQQPEVAGARAQHRDRALGAADRDLEIEIRMDAPHLGQQRRKDVETDRHAADQPQRAAQRLLLVADRR